MTYWKRAAVLTVILGLRLSAANLNLKPATVNAWNSYVQEAEGRIESAPPLDLTIDRSPIVRVTPAAGSGIVSVPNGLIHDWVGATFVPHATVAQLQAVLHDYDHYKDIYSPTVVDSRGLQTGCARETFSMEWFRKVLNITAGIDAEYSSTQVIVNNQRGYTITRSTRIQEIRNLGAENEEKLPVDTGRGFIWRICSILWYQQANGGVYLQLEVIVLSRDIPHAVQWVANPIVNRLSRSSVATTLAQTREAVQTRSAALSGDVLGQAR